MNRRMAAVGFVLTLALGTAAVRCQEGGDDTRSWERYKVIVERNIFLPERSRPVQRLQAPVIERRVEPEVFLVGIARQGDEYIAVVEDRRARTTSRYKVGEETPQGRIAAITIDHVVFEKNEGATEVNVGARLASVSPAGVQAEQTVEEAGSGSSAEAADQARPSDASGGDAGSILERMRQRRQRELN